MSDLSDAIAFLNGYLARLITDNLDFRTLINQMTLGYANVAPPPGDPSLTSQLNNIVFQVQSLREHLDVANTEMISQNVDILAAIAALPDGSGPVVLPTTPPTGYGVDDGSIAGAVWAYHAGGYTQAAGDLLLDAGMMAINMSVAGVQFPISPTKYFNIRGTWFSTSGASDATSYPTFPIANILADDTLGVFLERESGFSGWTANGDGTWDVWQDSAHTDFHIQSRITDAEFLVLRDGPGAASAQLAPPVWPGVLNVTLGTPVSISTGFTVSETMDGVIVSITGVPTRANFFDFDGSPSYRNLGALSFFTDDNEQEQAQGLGFESQIYTPHTMFQAAGVKIRTVGGVTGTVTPWHRTPV